MHPLIYDWNTIDAAADPIQTHRGMGYSINPA